MRIFRCHVLLRARWIQGFLIRGLRSNGRAYFPKRDYRQRCRAVMDSPTYADLLSEVRHVADWSRPTVGPRGNTSPTSCLYHMLVNVRRRAEAALYNTVGRSALLNQTSGDSSVYELAEALKKGIQHPRPPGRQVRSLRLAFLSNVAAVLDRIDRAMRLTY
ncbi:hypothetical protein R1flu_022244 [Riccia fluitans]|uniref:Uncharacterized protein n=1 Tax=Riccia fluitans TaxID=41844 RepID=A0ABD1ZST9_9MARC